MKTRRNARILKWENDGAFVTISYLQEDGQRVIADFQRGFWHQPPNELREQVKQALARGPILYLGARGAGTQQAPRPHRTSVEPTVHGLAQSGIRRK